MVTYTHGTAKFDCKNAVFGSSKDVMLTKNPKSAIVSESLKNMEANPKRLLLQESTFSSWILLSRLSYTRIKLPNATSSSRSA